MAAFSIILILWIVVAGGFTAVTIAACARLAGHIAARPDLPRFPTLHVLRPCEGDEPGLRENLESTLLPYPAPHLITLLVPSEADPACAAAREVAARAPGRVEVLVTGVTSARNRKTAQLAVGLDRALAVWEAAGHGAPEAIVQIDSDVRLRPGTLVALAMALGAGDEVAAAFAAPVDVETRTLGDLAASGLLSASHQDFFAVAALAHLGGHAPSLSGALAVHRTAPLVAAGGFAPLERLLGEDWEVGRRLVARGLRVEVSVLPAICSDAGRDLASVIARTARWLMVVRRQRPGLIASYPLLLAPTPILLGLAAIACALGAWIPLAVAVALVGERVMLALVLRQIHGLPVGIARAFALSLSGELLMLVAAARALVARDVVWRGRRLRVGPGGVIEDDPAGPA